MKRGFVVSDLHNGSIYGLLPPDFVTFEDVPKPQNAGQKYLWECWEDYCDRTAAFRPDFGIINGDCVDGPQQKNHGSELSLIAPQDQTSACIQTIKRLKKGLPAHCKLYFTQGTPYHVGNFGASEEAVAEATGGTRYPSVGTGRLCREILWLMSRASSLKLPITFHARQVSIA